MTEISKTICENTCRRAVFEKLGIADNPDFKVISNRAFGVLVTDDNGRERMVEVRAIVRKVDENERPASEILEEEAATYAEEVEEKRRKKEEKKKGKKKPKNEE